MGWASRPSFLDGRDAHPTITIKIVSYLIIIPKHKWFDARTVQLSTMQPFADCQLSTVNCQLSTAAGTNSSKSG
ncbi:hypothetical protein [Microcoleus sp. PH2017_32_RDM_D_A]|uniref:hypothetical protein n=1 Tax=Microcoleus sp. PH2017_32_RDM_D_A TaxID=2798842 RepID=UPI0025E49EDD|nr:hypothetical protein [Microcoleus sp. PH2017_32_RDM_D_A]